MPRRIALALALAFTTVVTFAVIAVGAQAGLFSSDKAAKAEEAIAEVTPADTAVPEPPAQPAPPQAPVQSEPVVITEYVYVDQTAVAVNKAEAPPAVPPNVSPSATTTVPTVAKPTAPAPTEPPAPSATAAPAATATAPAAQQPAAPAAQKTEMEFTGTVTAIDGDQVTFAHGGTTTTVRVTQNLGALSIGTTAKVHALLTSTGYVAKEIEMGG